MSSTPITGPAPHPIVRAAARVGAALDEVSDVDPLFMRATEKATALVQLEHQQARLRALQLRVLALADDVAENAGARSPGAWLDSQVHLGHAEARRTERLASALALSFHQVAAALGAGQLTQGQATAIVAALDELPETLTPGLREKAEAHLIVLAADFDPVELRRLGRGVLDVLAPEISDAHEWAKLQAEERAAKAATRLTFRTCGDGTVQLSARIPDHTAARLRVYLEAIAAPRKTNLGQTTLSADTLGETTAAATGSADTTGPLRVLGPRRMGQAFCTLLETICGSDHLPAHGGTATTVTVLINFDDLRSQTGVGTLATGERLTAGEVRRLACTANILPAVLGTDSQVLDLGRTTRLFTPAQRKAMTIRDRNCRAEGCSIPAPWCEAHHANLPWSQGGRTDLADGVLLCSWHHHRAHDPDYDQRRLPDGTFRYTRRT